VVAIIGIIRIIWLACGVGCQHKNNNDNHCNEFILHVVFLAQIWRQSADHGLYMAQEGGSAGRCYYYYYY
jgi:hypothetical protein